MKKLCTFFLSFASFFGSAELIAEETVNIYSYRQTHLIQPLLNQFTSSTGIKTKVFYTKAGIAERMALEGERSPVDLILTSDIYRLVELKNKGFTQQVQSKKLSARIPEDLRDAQGHWFALTRRTRVIFASKDEKRAPKNEVESYEDLAKPGLGKRVCIRPLSHIYNLGLTASLIASKGEKFTQSWLLGLKKNLARKPQGNDRAQVKAITHETCDYAVANSYYFALLHADSPKWTNNIRIITPKRKKGGTHINISGMVLARYAPNSQNAIRLMEFLVGDWAQEYYASVNNEFPVVAHIPPQSFLLQKFGTFQAQELSLGKIALSLPKAQKLVNAVGIDN